MSQATHASPELLDDCEEFLSRYYEDAIASLAQRYPKEQQTLTIDWYDVFQFDPELAEDIRSKPDQILEYLEEALANYPLPIDRDFAGASVAIENISETYSFDVDELRSEQTEQLVDVSGQVQKLSEVKPKATSLAFECQRCGTSTTVHQDDTRMQEPHECQGCERQGPFRVDYDDSEFVDHRLARLQLPPEKAQGASGGSIDVVLEGDRVEAADAGDRVTVTGVLRMIAPDAGDKPTFETYLDGQSVQVEQTNFDEIDVAAYEEEILTIANGECGDPIELMKDSIAPKIQGHDTIKEALALQLFSGNQVQYPTGERDRGDFHALIIGDPGCGKSTLLDAIKEIAPRSTMASGKGATKSGMTAAAVRDDFGDTEWGLEAGALVVADKGIACVDEIDKVDDEVTGSLHRALEAQEVEINKAGINATLPARTSLLAAGNPQYGRFDQHEPIADQIDIDPPLLSRFDLIFVLMDDPEEEHDKEVARTLVEFRRQGTAYTHSDRDVDTSDIEPAIPHDIFRAYVAYARQNFHPTISEEAEEKLVEWYWTFRSLAQGDDAPIPVTPRYGEALVRLAEASARARLSETVEREDMARASELITTSMRHVGMDPESNEFDADVVETGVSKSQRERIKTVEGIIQELEDEYSRGAPHEVIVDRCQEKGLDREKTEHEIDKLKQKGEVYEHQSEYYRTS